ncbi:toll/interleukin-1 receptor domain-containing protein [Achromobacter sp. SD115]|uniref:toll/interleukin-1 receptor domain-containing protein n=1 Tax=Achromobacter sp. SD115 TaxID=2782011 RepID=UPI001A979EB5|nr:toll/interleukin-1 receptor domain-containing protein [Achromobacter sp. SD115]MBO1014732.1 toll/interleukin-1 receptor domain-containing protein [Achromobacter sp. SD115]
MTKIFFSYSHDDEQYRDQLEKHLASLQHEGLIESWHDRRIVAGSRLEAEIDQQINAADVILLLVSSSFLASRYCYTIEMTRALERHRAGDANVVPVIVRACDWQSTPLGELLAVPRDGRPVTSWPNYDEAYVDVAKQIRRLIQQRRTQTEPRSAPAAVAAASPSANVMPLVATVPRSSNLRLRKEFSDLDSDQFLHETFDFIARFFEGSLQELQARNPGVSGQFRQVDANTFTAAIYQQGKRACECSVHLGAGGFRNNGIVYSSDPAARGSSYNEMVSVESDEHAMFLRPMGMANFSERNKLTQEGAAELFWGMLIRPMQQ